MTGRTERNVNFFSEFARKDRNLIIRMIADMVNNNRETVRQILIDELNMTKICLKVVPESLNQEHKDDWFEMYSDIMNELAQRSSIVRKLGFYSMALKPNFNRCTERLKDAKKEKSSNELVEIEGNAERFSI